jgi:hypothetical protein
MSQGHEVVMKCVYISDSAVLPVLTVIKREVVTKVLINPIIGTRTRHSRHAYHPTLDNSFRKVRYDHLLFLMHLHYQASFRY